MSAIYNGCFGCANPKATCDDLTKQETIPLCNAHWNHWLAMFDPMSDAVPPCGARLII